MTRATVSTLRERMEQLLEAWKAEDRAAHDAYANRGILPADRSNRRRLELGQALEEVIETCEAPQWLLPPNA